MTDYGQLSSLFSLKLLKDQNFISFFLKIHSFSISFQVKAGSKLLRFMSPPPLQIRPPPAILPAYILQTES